MLAINKNKEMSGLRNDIPKAKTRIMIINIIGEVLNKTPIKIDEQSKIIMKYLSFISHPNLFTILSLIIIPHTIVNLLAKINHLQKQ